jgi:hypothetical protein
MFGFTVNTGRAATTLSGLGLGAVLLTPVADARL